MQITPDNLNKILSGPEHIWMERHRRARLLAEGLVLSLQIDGKGKGLVAWLCGPDDQRITDNLEAVSHWVFGKLDVPDQDEELGIEQLKASLRDTIDDLTDCE